MSSPTLAKEIRMMRYGAPEVLEWTSATVAPLARHEVRIATHAAAVNHTDLEIRAGAWPIRGVRPFPYVPGVEVVGVVAEVGAGVRDWSIGQAVITMMQGLGGVRAERPGGYAQAVTVSADVLAPVPHSVDLLDMAALGLPAVTAYGGLGRLGALDEKRVLVTGAAGGVGSAAVGLAHAAGAHVTALVTRPDQAAYVRELGAQEVLVLPKGDPIPLPAEAFDGVLDTVGGSLFGPCVNALRGEGVLSLVGAVAGGDVAFDAWQLIRPVTLTGYSTETLDGPALRQAITAVTDALLERALKPPRYRTFPLSQAAQAHALLEQGGVSGRVLLVADDPS